MYFRQKEQLEGGYKCPICAWEVARGTVCHFKKAEGKSGEITLNGLVGLDRGRPRMPGPGMYL